MTFEDGYKRLNEAYQEVVKNTILQMPKEHMFKEPKKKFRVGDVIKTYCKKAGVKLVSLPDRLQAFTGLYANKETIDYILSNKIIDCRKSEFSKDLFDLLEIPVNKEGIPYIEEDRPFCRERYLFTRPYYEYATEFQRNSVYQNFNCLSKENQRIIMRLVMELYQCELKLA